MPSLLANKITNETRLASNRRKRTPKDSSDAAGIPIVLINVPRCNPGDVGFAALPDREVEYHAAVDQCCNQAFRLGASKVNVLAGFPPADADPKKCAAILQKNLRHTADLMAKQDVRVMVEPVNGEDFPGFHLADLQSALDAIAQADRQNIALQFDFYHMAKTEPDLVKAIAQAGSRIGHVQIADTPGRHEPGTGQIDFSAALTMLRQQPYQGPISAEYHPAGNTPDGLGWLNSFRGILK